MSDEKTSFADPDSGQGESRTQNQRKRFFFFYNRPVQIKYAASGLVIIIAALMVQSYIIYSQVSKAVGRNANMSHDGEVVGSEAMQNLNLAIIMSVAVSILCLGTVCVLWAMLITHRYEGPIVRINAHLKKVASGDYSTDLVIRKHDEVQHLAENINLVTKRLRESRKS